MIKLNIQKRLNGSNGEILLDVNYTINRGELLAIHGPSGAGKTTLLRIIAGLTQADSGQINFNETNWFNASKKFSLPPQQRNIGYLFQDYALFPNMTVIENLEYAANKKHQQNINDLIEIIELGDLKNRKTNTLSGGQQQRVALARALAQQPQLLLLDEPLSALDTKMRSTLQNYILSLHKHYQLTTIIVSHDISEIYKLASNTIELINGKINRSGSPSQIFTNQHNSGKFSFIGEVVAIKKEDIIYIVSVLVGNNIIKVVATLDETKEFTIGSTVHLASKAFNPVIQPIKA